MVEMMERVEKEILVLLCKMERFFFSPSFFNPMQHLLIHLLYEAKVGGPIQYRWMYHIERALKYLKPMLAISQGLKGASPKHLHLMR
jgi:hypothetical protein